MNDLLYVGEYVVAEKLEKRKENKSNGKSKKNLGGRGKFRYIFWSGEKMSVD